MDRDSFNKLTVDEQVNYYREELSKGNSFNSICTSIGVSKNTIKPRFAKAGYIEIHKGKTNIIMDYVKKGQKRENIILEEEAPEVKAMVNNPIKENIKEDINSSYDDKVLNEILNKINLMEHRITELENKNNKNKDSSSVNNEFVVNSFSGDTVTRTFKIDAGVNSELDTIIKKYSMYKKQDIISSLLKIALDTLNK